MKSILKLLAALLIPSALVWLSVGFVLWNWNPEAWSEAARAAYVFFSLFLTLPAVGLFGDIA